MRIESNEVGIICVNDWKRFAPPKSEEQWKEGRSAFELASAWCGDGVPEMPADLRTLLDTRDETRGLVVEKVFLEYKISFDTHRGPRNADLAFVGDNASVVSQ
jgi:hypothetical protein